MSLEDTLSAWAKGPGTTEQTKCENAERVVREALRADSFLKTLDPAPRVFVQGSYKAHTNVRADSDVDICILLPDTYFWNIHFSDITENEVPGIRPAPLSFEDFRSAVETALVNRFGRKGVTRGNKAFDVHANTYRLDADVVAAFEHRRYLKRRPDGVIPYELGIEFRTDSGARIINWPDQTYANGVAKNNRTARMYKRAIRIVKRLRNQMQVENVAAAKDIGSFLIESLVWNVPDEGFAYDTYSSVIRYVLAHSFNGTIEDSRCEEWGEVNELKYIFKGSPGLRDRTHRFLSAAWDYLGFQ
jgi:hypothetical protein